MPTLSLPVSRLVRAVLTNIYGPGPIALNTGDIRKKELMHAGARDKHIERKRYCLNTTVELQLNRHDHNHVSSHAIEIGYYLHAQEKQRIYRFIWARVTAGQPAIRAIQDYYAENGITEDDYQSDTVARDWQRWRGKMKKDRLHFTPESVPQNATFLFSEKEGEKLAERIALLIRNNPGRVDPRYEAAAQSWVLCRLTNLTQQEVAKRRGRLRQSVARSAKRFDEYLQYNPTLRTVVGYCLATSAARPTPNLAS